MEVQKDVEGLIEVLRHGAGHVNWVAAEALGMIRDTRGLLMALPRLCGGDVRNFAPQWQLL